MGENGHFPVRTYRRHWRSLPVDSRCGPVVRCLGSPAFAEGGNHQPVIKPSQTSTRCGALVDFARPSQASAGGVAVQMLMRPDVIVPGPKRDQLGGQVVAVEGNDSVGQVWGGVFYKLGSYSTPDTDTRASVEVIRRRVSQHRHRRSKQSQPRPQCAGRGRSFGVAQPQYRQRARQRRRQQLRPAAGRGRDRSHGQPGP